MIVSGLESNTSLRLLEMEASWFCRFRLTLNAWLAYVRESCIGWNGKYTNMARCGSSFRCKEIQVCGTDGTSAVDLYGEDSDLNSGIFFTCTYFTINQ